MSGTYLVQRYYFDDEFDREVLATGLSLEEAQEMCRNNPEGSSRTATSEEANTRTEKCGPWFEGFEEE